MSYDSPPDVVEPSSPEDGGNFRRSLQIDMKGLVGDAVGNMSISPGSRDVVLAARKGLFIIDLEAPLNIPRFLPQGGTWDVADVQWNPHLSRGEYIISTSSEKLLIWNLLLGGKTSIEHVLRAHYRAITDINWHTTDPDLVVSTGIDSWLWAWDIRTPQRPIIGLCGFNAGGTQVKWNRQDGNMLASSHMNEVLIWDRRKGSLPVSRLPAHNAKIYGIDWSHDRRNEIVTCSLDKTIKIWDTHTCTPKIVINTRYPVWRARDLPFGRGVLSLPQRGETALELFAHENAEMPIETFEGHADVVKEFVWRKGDGSEFQLITWSKDRTLRFWPVDAGVMQRAGTTPTPQTLGTTAERTELKVSFSNPPAGSDLPPALSAPVGHRSILAEVRAPFPPQRPRTHPAPIHNRAQASSSEDEPGMRPTTTRSRPVPISHGKGVTMSRGHLGGRSAQINTFAWLSSVKVGERRDGSSGRGSAGESGTVSRRGSASRAPSLQDRSTPRTRSRNSRNDTRESEDHREDAAQSLQDEITSATSKLSSSKVHLELEKADLTKKRTCTFGLEGPWGESNTSVFIRITFTFPKDYPHASYPNGVPIVDLERDPRISAPTREFIIKRLRLLRQRQRPCLEKCLRFLLFAEDSIEDEKQRVSDSDSSSDDEGPLTTRKYRDLAYLARSDKHMAEPRTSQGVFGVNGELVCFFRAPPRIVRNPMKEISVSPSVASKGPETSPRLFRSPAVLSDAIRRLGVAAYDRDEEDVDPRKSEDPTNILRIMTNLFGFAQQKPPRTADFTKSFEDIPSSYSLLPTRRSQVFIKKTSALVGVDTAAAQEYDLVAEDPASLCKANAQIAHTRGRGDHERFFLILEPVFVLLSKAYQDVPSAASHDAVATHIIEKLYEELAASKDIQLLAMMSVLLLWTASLRVGRKESLRPGLTPRPSTYSQRGGIEAFARRSRSRGSNNKSLSPAWNGPSPLPGGQPVAPTLSSPSSSKGSWSSLFTANHMKHLVTSARSGTPIPVPTAGKLQRGLSSPSPYSGDQPSPLSPVTKSWTEASGVTLLTSTAASAGHPRRPTYSQAVSARPAFGKREVRFHPVKDSQPPDILEPWLRTQLLCHVLAYAEMLLAWELPQKRNELLKLVEKEFRGLVFNPAVATNVLVQDELGQTAAPRYPTPSRDAARRSTTMHCSICRLPIKGLSIACSGCLHLAHAMCWEGWRSPNCPAGCGCLCVLAPERAAHSVLEDGRSLSPLKI